MDLFDDLPPPSSVKNDLETKSDKKHENGSNLKRKSQDNCEGIEIKVSKRTQNSKGLLCLSSYIAERKGERDEMQDMSTLTNDCTDDYFKFNCGVTINRVAFFGVYDGHGGKRASNYIKTNLQDNIKKYFPDNNINNFDKELKKCLIQAFKKTDDDFIEQASKVVPHWRDGSTLSCVIIINNILYAANIGDTKTLLIRRDEGNKPKVINLSKDHSPTLYEERQRIQSMGGFVRDGRVQGVLEVSRAIGDARFKKYVISTPEIFKTKLTNDDNYFLIACDGLWKGFTVTQVVEYIDNLLNEKNDIDIDKKYDEICKKVASEAIRRGSTDNVTVLIVRIGNTY